MVASQQRACSGEVRAAYLPTTDEHSTSLRVFLPWPPHIVMLCEGCSGPHPPQRSQRKLMAMIMTVPLHTSLACRATRRCSGLRRRWRRAARRSTTSSTATTRSGCVLRAYMFRRAAYLLQVYISGEGQRSHALLEATQVASVLNTLDAACCRVPGHNPASVSSIQYFASCCRLSLCCDRHRVRAFSNCPCTPWS